MDACGVDVPVTRPPGPCQPFMVNAPLNSVKLESGEQTAERSVLPSLSGPTSSGASRRNELRPLFLSYEGKFTTFGGMRPEKQSTTCCVALVRSSSSESCDRKAVF